MSYILRTLRRERSYLVAEQVHESVSSDRVVIIEALTPEWFRRAMPHQDERARREPFFDAQDKPRCDGIYSLLSSPF
jgi:hypothetical protein